MLSRYDTFGLIKIGVMDEDSSNAVTTITESYNMLKNKGISRLGVDLTSATVCQREPTIDRLLECLFKEHIILIRSPPMTGKTSLGQLLEAKLLQLDELQNGSACVFRISLIWMENLIDPSWTFADGFQMLMNITWNEFLQQCSDKKTYLIIDEVQKIYRKKNGEPCHGGSAFWNAFKRIMQNLQLSIVALASYGHYGAYATRGKRSDMDISPLNNLTTKNEWGYKDICYTKEEFRVYFDRFSEEHLKEKLVKDDIPYLFNYLSKITVCYPGLIVYTMDHIGERFTKKDSNSLSFDIIFSYLKSHDFNDLLKTIHAFYPASDLSYEERRIVDAVLFKKGGLDYEAEKIPNDGQLLKTNALVDTSSNKSHLALLDFPAPLL
nr:8445_t:CDS:2 [Entrophospora candida]